MNKLKTAILISGRGSNMQALVRAAQMPNFPAEIVCVISNNPAAGGLAWAQEQGLPVTIVDHKPFEGDRQKFEEALSEKLDSFGAQLICLAGFMRILSPWFVEQWLDRLVNIHPSLLPAFPGLHVQKKAIDYGAKFSGCTVHFVRAEMDCGPIIVQAAVPVLPDDNEDILSARILECEHKIYPQALRWIAEGRVNVLDGRCFVINTSAPSIAINPRGV